MTMMIAAMFVPSRPCRMQDRPSAAMRSLLVEIHLPLTFVLGIRPRADALDGLESHPRYVLVDDQFQPALRGRTSTQPSLRFRTGRSGRVGTFRTPARVCSRLARRRSRLVGRRPVRRSRWRGSPGRRRSSRRGRRDQTRSKLFRMFLDPARASPSSCREPLRMHRQRVLVQGSQFDLDNLSDMALPADSMIFEFLDGCSTFDGRHCPQRNIQLDPLARRRGRCSRRILTRPRCGIHRRSYRSQTRHPRPRSRRRT